MRISDWSSDVCSSDLFGPTVRAFRTVQPFGGRVHLSATATGTAKGFNQDFASEAVIYASDDVAGAPWAPANVEGFGNKDDTTVFAMAEFVGHLYAGNANPITDGALWMTITVERMVVEQDGGTYKSVGWMYIYNK